MPGSLRFEWDTRKAAANRARHKVSFDEAVTVFGDPLGRITNDSRHSVGEERFVLLGQSKRRRLLVVMFTERRGVVRLIVPGRQRVVSGERMKRVKAKRAPGRSADVDEVMPEYDFTQARPNTYASRYAQGSIVVTLDPDVAAVFPGAQEANEALRALAGVIRRHRARRPSRRSA